MQIRHYAFVRHYDRPADPTVRIQIVHDMANAFRGGLGNAISLDGQAYAIEDVFSLGIIDGGREPDGTFACPMCGHLESTRELLEVHFTAEHNRVPVLPS